MMDTDTDITESQLNTDITGRKRWFLQKNIFKIKKDF